MAIETVTMHRVLCDRCGVSAQDDAEFYAWADAEQAVDSAIESEWVAIEGKHYCEDCVEWNEDDDQLVPRPPWERESGPDHSGPQERRVKPMGETTAKVALIEALKQPGGNRSVRDPWTAADAVLAHPAEVLAAMVEAGVVERRYYGEQGDEGSAAIYRITRRAAEGEGTDG